MTYRYTPHIATLMTRLVPGIDATRGRLGTISYRLAHGLRDPDELTSLADRLRLLAGQLDSLADDRRYEP